MIFCDGRRVAALLTTALAGFVFSACGSSGSSGGTAMTAGPGVTTSQAAPAGAAPAGAAPAGAAPAGAAPVESNPPGDIPDTVAYVSYVDPGGAFRFRHPEGWAQTAVPAGVRFADKLNSVTVTAAAGPPPSVANARARLVPTLDVPAAAFQLGSVTAASVPAGPAVRVVWRRNSPPDAVTGRIYRDEVVSYLVGGRGRVVRMDLSGPVGADNVDPYKTMSDSLAVG